jgi:hypothetical protein
MFCTRGDRRKICYSFLILGAARSTAFATKGGRRIPYRDEQMRSSIPLHSRGEKMGFTPTFPGTFPRRKDGECICTFPGVNGGIYEFFGYIVESPRSIPAEGNISVCYTVKKRFTSSPSPAGMSLTKLPLGRNNLVLTSMVLSFAKTLVINI